MKTITLNQVQNNLNHYIQQTIDDNDEITISTDGGAVVLMSEREWNSIHETLLILKDQVSLAALLNGHRSRKNGEVPNSTTPEIAFYDLQD
jgi:prevent-host-death family protein